MDDYRRLAVETQPSIGGFISSKEYKVYKKNKKEMHRIIKSLYMYREYLTFHSRSYVFKTPYCWSTYNDITNFLNKEKNKKKE